MTLEEIEVLHRRVEAAIKRHHENKKARESEIETRKRDSFRKDFEELARKVGIKLEF